MPVGIQLLVAFLIGGGLGLLIGWLMGRGRDGSAPDARLENELRQQLTQREGELNQSRQEAVQIKTALATADANRIGAEKLLAEQRSLQARALAEAKESQAKAIVDLREAFQALSAEALKQTQPEFLRLANETMAKFQEGAKGDLSQRQEAIKGMVEPLRVQLERYQQQLQQSETTQAGALGEVRKQLESLSLSSQSLATETAQFRSVLKSNQARGRWGEETLRRVVEAAGMSPHCDFLEQSSGDEGKPDLIVRLPGDRVVIVDSKVPDLEVVNAAEVADPQRRKELLAGHAAKLRLTIKNLSDRNYPKQFANTLDHVVLFLPAESLFSAALEGDPELIVWAESRRVYLATPASFIAVLRTIDFIWQQHKQTANAMQIAEAARAFYERVATFTKHFDDIGKGLANANEAFNKAAASYQTRVRPAGERLSELGGNAPGKELADIQPREATLLPPPK